MEEETTMDDFLANIEKSRNTEGQLDFYRQLSDLADNCGMSAIGKVSAFPVFASRQLITYFIERYEIFKLCLEVPGSIVECGVGSGFGLMAFAHLSSIFEPYHYVRHVIGFDTFEGFVGITEKDRTSAAGHMKEGGLNYGSFETISRAVAIHDLNRCLGHLKKVELVKGDISETLPRFLKERPETVIGLLYLDLDLYQPTVDTLTALLARIPRGGIIAFDELNHPDYPGETLAAMEAVGIQNLRLRRLPISSMASYAVVE
jgi:hypothetical protein